MNPVVSGLHHYPIKSCRGISLVEAAITPHGLEQDRHWMVVDHKGRFLSQRRFPRMALIRATPGEESLKIQAPDMSPLMVPADGEGPLAVRVWGFEGMARDAGEAAAQWFTEFLGVRCRLAAPGPAFQRPVDSHYGQGEVMFSDGFPFLLIGEGALDQLNAKLDEPVSMDRFRPNIVVSGAAPHAEDGWKRIRIGETLFQVVKPCSRCTIPTVHQGTGERGEEPSRTLASYRTGDDGEIYFGQNLIHESHGGVLRVGDPVEVLA